MNDHPIPVILITMYLVRTDQRQYVYIFFFNNFEFSNGFEMYTRLFLYLLLKFQNKIIRMLVVLVCLIL